MRMNPLELLKDKILDLPVIQGGMGVGVSLSSLAGAVAREGGMGVISSAQIGFEDPDFLRHPHESNLSALDCHVRRAKEISMGKGLVGVNIMVALQDYANSVKTACEAGVDAIISGAGLPLELPKFVEGFQTAIAPIVSSAKAASVILKHWTRKYNRTADFLVVEGPKAGGHLGFKPEQLMANIAATYDDEIRSIIAVKKEYEEKFKRKIPLFVAGGIFTAGDVEHALDLGADGVQCATRFVVTEECDASRAYKQAYIDANAEDVSIIKSPVGMPGRALRNSFIRRVEEGMFPITKCYRCLKACDPRTAPYCITQALVNAVKGNLEEGLIFCGERVSELKEMTTVKKLMQELTV